jgi:hypothetical protein
VKTNFILSAALLTVCLSAEQRANAQLTILHHFGSRAGVEDGASPSAGLIQAADGNFYGPTTTKARESKGFEGTIFQITPAGVERVIHTFTRGVGSSQPLLSYNGSLVGVSVGTRSRRYGKVFALTESRDGHWSLSDWYLFSTTGGNGPVAPLIAGSDGNLYGTTQFRWQQGSRYHLQVRSYDQSRDFSLQLYPTG